MIRKNVQVYKYVKAGAEEETVSQYICLNTRDYK